MNGVEILSATEVVTKSIYNYWLAGFVFLGILIFGTIIIRLMLPEDGALGIVAGLIVGVFVGSFGYVIVINETSEPIAYETQYKVTISDEVSMNEFIDKYEIIDQEGKIYTVRERN